VTLEKYYPGDIIKTACRWGLALDSFDGLAAVVPSGTPIFVVASDVVPWDPKHVHPHGLFVIAVGLLGWLCIVDEEDCVYIHLVARY
jgi:hypothetical protein